MRRKPNVIDLTNDREIKYIYYEDEELYILFKMASVRIEYLLKINDNLQAELNRLKKERQK